MATKGISAGANAKDELLDDPGVSTVLVVVGPLSKMRELLLAPPLLSVMSKMRSRPSKLFSLRIISCFALSAAVPLDSRCNFSYARVVGGGVIEEEVGTVFGTSPC